MEQVCFFCHLRELVFSSFERVELFLVRKLRCFFFLLGESWVFFLVRIFFCSGREGKKRELSSYVDRVHCSCRERERVGFYL